MAIAAMRAYQSPSRRQKRSSGRGSVTIKGLGFAPYVHGRSEPGRAGVAEAVIGAFVPQDD